jgi:Major Facilitator Superfamily
VRRRDRTRARPSLTAEPVPTLSRAVEAANRTLNRNDSVAVGVVNAAAPFLPVLLVRLGASGVAVGLITALPAVAGALLALPLGRWLQGRGDIVPAYSWSRLIAHTIYAPIAVALWLVPVEWTVAAVLVLWAVAMIPNTIGQVAFPIVMDGTAGSRGRYELLGRRWAIIGLVTAITMAGGGQLLRTLPFPGNYQLFLVVCATGGIGSFYFARRYVIPTQVAGAPAAMLSPLAGLRDLLANLRSERPFAAFELRSLVYSAGIGLAAPLLPLFYVHEVSAPDAVIGLIGAGQSLGALAGYVTWRLISRRWGRSSVLVPALLLGALSPAALFAIHDQVLVVAVAVISGFGSAGTGLALFDELMQRVPMRLGVTFASIDQTIQNAALIVAPILGGTLSVAVGIRPALVLASIVSLGGLGLFLLDLYHARAS